MSTQDSKRIIPKLVYMLKRSVDEWIGKKLCCTSQECFNKAQLPLFMSIGTAGISNNALAANLNVSKQAASKVIKELEELGLVRNEKCSTDARSVMLYLTDDGIRFYHHIKAQMVTLEDEYKKVVGSKNYEIAVDVMIKLLDYHEKLNRVGMN